MKHLHIRRTAAWLCGMMFTGIVVAIAFLMVGCDSSENKDNHPPAHQHH